MHPYLEICATFYNKLVRKAKQAYFFFFFFACKHPDNMFYLL